MRENHVGPAVLRGDVSLMHRGDKFPELPSNGGHGTAPFVQIASHAPRESVVTPLVTGLSYDYYDAETNRWSNETMLKSNAQGQPMVPQRLRLKFTYNKMTRESVVTLPIAGQALPAF